MTATDTEEFASRQQKADRLAKEIVTGAEVELSTQLDEEASEEDKYSAVVRPGKSDELPPMVEEKETQPLPLEDTAEESPGTARGRWCVGVLWTERDGRFILECVLCR